MPSDAHGRLSELEVTMFMDTAIRIGMGLVRKNGFLIPAFYAMGRRGPMNIAVDDEIVVHRNENMEYDNLFEGQEETVYCTVLVMCIQNHHQDEQMRGLAREIASDPKVEALGLVEGAYYRQGVKISQNEHEPIQKDPDSRRIIHACYYLRGNPVPRLMNIPFIDRGELPVAPDSEQRHEIYFAHSTWVEDRDNTEAHKIEYPFGD